MPGTRARSRWRYWSQPEENLSATPHPATPTLASRAGSIAMHPATPTDRPAIARTAPLRLPPTRWAPRPGRHRRGMWSPVPTTAGAPTTRPAATAHPGRRPTAPASDQHWSPASTGLPAQIRPYPSTPAARPPTTSARPAPLTAVGPSRSYAPMTRPPTTSARPAPLTAVGPSRSYAPMTAYGQSKLAVLMFARELDRRSRAAGWGIISNAAHPGLTKTNLQIAGPSHGRDKPALMERLYKTSWRFAPFLWQEIEEGILPALYAAATPQADGGAFYGPRGRYEVAGGGVREAKVPAAARNDADSKRLWEVSEQLTGVSYPKSR
ncbi:Hypothetical protein AFL40_2351 [Mycobacterium tuberculosis]|nr:Hypothetical protein AFL40_2351 [Mycobacterium tuberculosis]